MSAESAYLSTFGAETETEAEIRSTSRYYRALENVSIALALSSALTI